MCRVTRWLSEVLELPNMSDVRMEVKSVKQTIITDVEAPSLRGVSVKYFIEFRKLHELYEKQIIEKSRQTDSEITAISIKASVGIADLGRRRTSRKKFSEEGCWNPLDAIIGEC